MPILAKIEGQLILLDDTRYYSMDVENVVAIYDGTVVAKFAEAYVRYEGAMKSFENLPAIAKIEDWIAVRKCQLVHTLRVLRAAALDEDDQHLLDEMIEERTVRAIHVLTTKRVVAAAILLGGTPHWTRPPARHPDLIKFIQASGIKEPEDGYEQGFLLSDGSYADRSRAWEVAEAAGQLLMRDRQRPGMLFSEDLW